MQKGTVLVKEVIGSGIESVRIDKCLAMPFPVKEIFEVRQNVLPVRAVVGNSCVAYFGEIEFKIYCVSEHDHSLRLVCEKVHYKGFSFFEQDCLHGKPKVKVTTHVKDVFTEISGPETIQIFAILSTELILTSVNYRHPLTHETPLETEGSQEGYEIELLDNGSAHGISVEVLPG